MVEAEHLQKKSEKDVEPMFGFSVQGHCRNVEVQYEAFQFVLNSENRVLTFIWHFPLKFCTSEPLL